MLQAVERYMKQAIVDKVPSVSSSALVSSLVRSCDWGVLGWVEGRIKRLRVLSEDTRGPLGRTRVKEVLEKTHPLRDRLLGLASGGESEGDSCAVCLWSWDQDSEEALTERGQGCDKKDTLSF